LAYLQDDKSCLAVSLVPLFGLWIVKLYTFDGGMTQTQPIGINHIIEYVLLKVKNAKRSSTMLIVVYK